MSLGFLSSRPFIAIRRTRMFAKGEMRFSKLRSRRKNPDIMKPRTVRTHLGG